MFFQNISAWSKKLMWSVTLICYAIYVGLILVAPAIVVMTKYHVFQKTEGMRYVTGLGLIVIVITGIASFVFVKKSLKKLPQASIGEQRFKFAIDTIFDCFPLGISLYAMFAVKDDIELFFNTLQIVLLIFFIGVLWNGLFIKFIDAEWVLRNKAKENKEVDKRKGVV